MPAGDEGHPRRATGSGASAASIGPKEQLVVTDPPEVQEMGLSGGSSSSVNTASSTSFSERAGKIVAYQRTVSSGERLITNPQGVPKVEA